ncbi:MAG TPA: S8/S53 family peptidase [Cellvibrio sp.]|nr:S8/S53 family peptidase [Cellvibrio sp.]
MRKTLYRRWSACLMLLFIIHHSYADALRIQHLERCGDIFNEQTHTFCLTLAEGAPAGKLKVKLNGKSLPAAQVQRADNQLRITLSGRRVNSGPVWIEHARHASNAVWLSMGGSHVAAATEADVAKNMDGLTTYVNLVSVIIEERYEGLTEARRLAQKYNASIVGMIPPLNTYQLRLPANNLIERDALVLRLGSEVSVDAVVIEETDPEKHAEQHFPAEGETELTTDKPDETELIANRFFDAVDFYKRHMNSAEKPNKTHPIRIGIIERNVDFDSPDFSEYLGDCRHTKKRTCLYGRDADTPDSHGSTVAGILAATWDNGGNSGFLRGFDNVGPAFDVIVERNSDAGITANIAASVNLVEDGVRVLNWSWGIHRVGTKNIDGEAIDSLIRSGLAMSGYEELLEEFFLWLRMKHPEVVVVNSAGNGASFSGRDEYRLPSSFITEQLIVVGGHERSDNKNAQVDDPDFVIKRDASNIDMRVDITAAACVHSSTLTVDKPGEIHCGTSYATPLVAGTLAAMLSINPSLTPEQLRMLLRRSAMTIGQDPDFEPPDADDLTSPILPSERNNQLHHPDVGRSARLDMHKALDLSIQSLTRVR